MKGLIQIYTGDGKGKTTAALGLALRAIGWGMKVCMIQFAKNQKVGEIIISKTKIPQLSIHQFGQKQLIKKPIQKDKLIAQKGLIKAEKIIRSQKYDIVILDEINIALYHKLLDEKKVLEILKNKPESVEIVLTGRKASKKIIAAADLVTEMKSIKHPFEKNIKARKGIEY